ncbi:hypothetical protein LTR28_006409 [Elasticomyces elasticus]|nr:hypothetical protein LTR28_006409 [Elasticomyces elasticus]
MPTLWLSDSQNRDSLLLRGWVRIHQPFTCTAEPSILITVLTGGFFFLGGIILFFDRAMYVPLLVPSRPCLAQILFLAGTTLLLGPHRTLLFFLRRQKLRGTACLAAGLLLILLRWALPGFCLELYAIFLLFGEFFKTVAAFAYRVPVVGPVLARGLREVGERAGEGGRNRDLPV